MNVVTMTPQGRLELALTRADRAPGLTALVGHHAPCPAWSGVGTLRAPTGTRYQLVRAPDRTAVVTMLLLWATTPVGDAS